MGAPIWACVCSNEPLPTHCLRASHGWLGSSGHVVGPAWAFGPLRFNIVANVSCPHVIFELCNGRAWGLWRHASVEAGLVAGDA